ncbi:hypothetical protein G4B88_026579 [Cannabis sativa]|uniref:Uncharacterized protein n=1 Tax=Cannabis sativa TaxID=3483 RepID=A0A7J6GQS2_CANSA|nr:hypothetical protein G4B88_026579 [Cannabis sativa]
MRNNLFISLYRYVTVSCHVICKEKKLKLSGSTVIRYIQLGILETCHGREEGRNKHTWRAQYNRELNAAFGKDESLQKRNLLILSQLDGPAAPRKRIEEAFDSFMHAPLGSGGYSSVGRAPLLQLGRCDYGLGV